MKILSNSVYNYNQPAFKSIKYKIHPFMPIKFNVEVDNDEGMGKEPCLVNEYFKPANVLKMDTDEKGNHYTEFFNPFLDGAVYPLNYYIKYEDTGKIYSNNGENYQVDSANLVRKAAMEARKQHRQPSVKSLKDGATIGKILFEDRYVYDTLNNIKEPSILVCQHHDSYLENPNIVGIIRTQDGNERCSHRPLKTYAGIDVSALVLEPDIVNKFKELNGKNVELKCENERIDFQETDKLAKPMNTEFVDVPKFDYCDRILTPKEYAPNIIGNKAVNLGKLENLKEQGKIDVIIPKSIALPYGFIEPFIDDYSSPTRKLVPDRRRELIANGTMDKIIKSMKDNGVDAEMVMVRSAFNTEDLPNVYAEGVYDSYKTNISANSLFGNIYRVVNSKYYNDGMYFSSINNIPDENIQPAVIIQNRVEPDYKLRIYTDDKSDNVKINVFSGELAVHSDAFHPHIFRYNKKTNELTYDSIQMTESTVTYDENENLLDITPVEEDLSDNKKLFRQLERVVKNALTVEQEFGVPQDIEGGIKGDNIYFWQTKNIVR